VTNSHTQTARVRIEFVTKNDVLAKRLRTYGSLTHNFFN
jgi:hypothetical protein